MFTLPPLPYGMNDLEPYISGRTLEFHYNKHHLAYVNNANNMLESSLLKNEDPETIIREAAKDPALKGLFNNAAQAWNHAFYWNCLKPGGGEPHGPINELIREQFGDAAHLKSELKNAAATLFGSGWAWLVLKDGALQIRQYSNADTPIVHDEKPLLTIDVWEHAYYLDYQNRRPDYLEALLNHLINWDFVNTQLER